jgi:uncharacterized membrane protein
MSLDLKRLAAKENRRQLVRGLGWFSIGLGLAEFLAPRELSRLCGLPYRPLLLRVLGLREIASGVGLLTQSEPAPWLKARVAGDTMDIGLLGASFLADDANARRLALTTGAVAGVAALDVLCSQDATDGAAATGPGALHFERSVIINRPAEELYNLWRKFDQLPCFMSHLISVLEQGDRSHWVAKGPAGTELHWDAEILNERQNELIAWRSLPGGDVDHVGSVRFQPARGGRGTLVRVELQYRPPAGRAGATIAKLLGQSLEKQVDVDLRRFKQWVETREIAPTEAQSAVTSTNYNVIVRG